nr:ribonuclease H-like domain-containing protein [Eubacterium sp.]
MQIFNNTISLSTDCFAILNAYAGVSKEQICIFDIETTGFSPKVSSLYLIGALWYNANEKTFYTRQWFADDYISEKEIIENFTEFLSTFTTLVHYNGGGFDIPYIEKKCKDLHIPSPFLQIESLDIFKEIRRLKPLFDVPNLKLLTAEKLVGFLRKDLLSGKDCIETYSQFMQKKFFKDNSKDVEREKLLLHNQEDLIGTWHCSRLLSYHCIGKFHSINESDTNCQISFTAPLVFPFPLKWEVSSSFTLRLEDQWIHLEIQLHTGELCHFFKNYKDYYYLPEEDTAIHKSVGAYVEKEFRQQAKACNCYIRQNAIFLPVPEGYPHDEKRFFRMDYKNKQNYVIWDANTKQDSSFFEEILSIIMASF